MLVLKRGGDRFDRRPRERRRHKHGLLGSGRQRPDPLGRERLNAAGHRQRPLLAGLFPRAAQGAGDLEREQRITAGGLSDAREHRASERTGEPAADDVMQRRERERTEDYAHEPVLRQGVVEVERSLILALGALRQQHPQLSGKPACRELERALRRGIHPLHVVDRYEHRSLAGELAEHTDQRRGRRARVSWLDRRDAQQRGRERTLLGRGQRGSRLVERRADDVGEHRVGEPGLALRRASPQHTIGTRFRETNRLKPDRRLPDPRLALK